MICVLSLPLSKLANIGISGTKCLMLVGRNAGVFICRKCQQNQVFFKSDSRHPYCKNACEPLTMCGEVKVPEEHLDVCRVCNAFGQNCGVVGSQDPGQGIHNADFVFYISAMETERCQKGMTVAYAAHCQQEAALDR